MKQNRYALDYQISKLNFIGTFNREMNIYIKAFKQQVRYN